MAEAGSVQVVASLAGLAGGASRVVGGAFVDSCWVGGAEVAGGKVESRCAAQGVAGVGGGGLLGAVALGDESLLTGLS